MITVEWLDREIEKLEAMEKSALNYLASTEKEKNEVIEKWEFAKNELESIRVCKTEWERQLKKYL